MPRYLRPISDDLFVSSIEERGAKEHPLWIVHVQNIDRRASRRCPACDPWSVECEMIVPALCAGVEQFNNFIGLGIDSGQIARFVEIAVSAGEGKVRQLVGSTMLARPDVLDVKFREGRG